MSVFNDFNNYPEKREIETSNNVYKEKSKTMDGSLPIADRSISGLVVKVQSQHTTK